jgi:hypothetical protein
MLAKPNGQVDLSTITATAFSLLDEVSIGVMFFEKET